MKIVVPFFLAFLFLSMAGNAQRTKVQNLPEFDERWLHFGFGLSVNSASFEMTTDPKKIGGDSLFGIEAQPQMGFNINMLAAYHIARTAEIRFFPGISFGQRNLQYSVADVAGTPELVTKTVEATNLEFPLFLKYRSDRLNNFAAYMLLGGYYHMDLAAQADTDNSKNKAKDVVIKTKRHKYGYTIGAGTDFFLDFYKMSLELKYNVGLNNTFIQDNTFFARPIDIIKERMVVFSITFEG